MDYVKARCGKCGVELLADKNRDKWFCGYCGFLFTIGEHLSAGTDENGAPRLTELESGLVQARELAKANEQEAALKLLKPLAEKYTLTFSVWECLAEVYLSKYRRDGYIMDEKNITFPLTGIAEKVRRVGIREQAAALNRTISDFYLEAAHGVRKGEFHLLAPNDGWSEYGVERALHILKYASPVFEWLVQEGKKIAQQLGSMCIHYGLPHQGSVMNEAQISFWPDFREQRPYCGVKTFAVLGTDCFVGFWGADGSHFYCCYQLPFKAEDNDSFYLRAGAMARENALALSKCPVCSGMQIKIKKEDILGKRRIWKCQVCGSFCVC